MERQDSGYEEAASTVPPWSLTGATEACNPLLRPKVTYTDLSDLELAGGFILNDSSTAISIFAEYPHLSPSNPSVIESGQSAGDNTLPLVTRTMDEIFSSLAGPSMADHLIDSLLESLQRSDSGFSGI